MAPLSVDLDPLRLALVFVAAVVGGAVNSIAGGGTLLTFPALIGLGVPALIANATSTVALWPGTVASIWGYRDLLVGMRSWARLFAVPSADQIAGDRPGGVAVAAMVDRQQQGVEAECLVCAASAGPSPPGRPCRSVLTA